MTQTNTDLLLQRLAAAQAARGPQEPQWHENRAFYEGNHWARILPSTGRAALPPAPAWRIRTTTNFILPIVEHFRARLLRYPPSLRALPTCPESQPAATTLQHVLDHAWDAARIPELLDQTVLHVFLYGTGIIETLPGTGPRAVSPFDFWPEPGATSLAACRYAFSRLNTHKDALAARLPHVADLLRNLPGTTQNPERIDALIYAERPNPAAPHGHLALLAGGLVLEDGPLPPGAPPMPFIAIRDQLAEGAFHGHATIAQVLSLQREYNRLRSQIAEQQRLALTGKILVPQGAGVDDAAFSARPGEIIAYTPPHKPEILRPPEVSPQAFQQLQDLQAGIRDVAGVHEVSDGAIPGGITSGVAISVLQDLDEKRFTTVRRRFHAALAELGEHLLILAGYAPGAAGASACRLAIAVDDTVSPRDLQRYELLLKLFEAGAFNGPTGQPDTHAFARQLNLPGLLPPAPAPVPQGMPVETQEAA